MEEQQRRSLQKSDYLIAGGFFLFTFLALLFTNSFYGMVWDEGFYYPTYKLVSAWFGLLVSDPSLAISSEGISTHWSEIRELPPVTKYIGALSTSFAPTQNPILGMRLLFMGCFALTVAVISLIPKLLNPQFSTAASLIPAFFYMFHPRLFAHGHIAATESVFSLITAISILIVVIPMTPIKKACCIMLVMVLACATKVNGLILCIAIFCYYILVLFQQYKKNSQLFTKKNIITISVILCFSPLILFAIWPWMWYETGTRLIEYWKFITEHAHLGTWYFGERLNVGEKLVPWHYPLVMTLVATPVLMLVCMVAGVGLFLRELYKKTIPLISPWVYVVLLILGPYSSMILTGAPKYDGIRLFIPVFVPLVLFISFPINWLIIHLPKVHKIILGIISIILLCETTFSLRNGINYYNFPTIAFSEKKGGFPFETSYWMEAFQPELFHEMLKDSGKSEIRVITRALKPEVLLLQQEWGLIPKGILFNPEPPYDYHLIQNRRGFWTEVDWWLFANRESLYPDQLQPEDPRFFVYDGRPPYTYTEPAKPNSRENP